MVRRVIRQIALSAQSAVTPRPSICRARNTPPANGTLRLRRAVLFLWASEHYVLVQSAALLIADPKSATHASINTSALINGNPRSSTGADCRVGRLTLAVRGSTGTPPLSISH